LKALASAFSVVGAMTERRERDSPFLFFDLGYFSVLVFIHPGTQVE
jgi:hypothetical protein